MSFLVSAVVDDLSTASGIRHSTERALELAIEYQRQGFTNIRITTGEETLSLEELRMIVG